MSEPVKSKRLETVDGGYTPNIASALRATLKEGYSFAKFRSDAMAGVTVGIVALPLAMALAIASGVPPQYGIYTAIVAGAVTALLGGSKVNVTGPTAAFVVLLVPVATKYGLSGLLLAGLMAGVILILMGLGKMGRLIQYIPHPVTTGFTAGIAVVIATIQLKDFFGLSFEQSPESYIERVESLIGAANTFRWADLLTGAFTLAVLLFWPKVTKRVPSPLVAVTLAAAGVYALAQFIPEFEQVATIGSRFSYVLDGVEGRGIPQIPPMPGLPWEFHKTGEKELVWSFATAEALVQSAFAIAMLGAIESLLCAVVADGMAQTKHDPDAELVGLGVANVLCPFFGGIAATGAIARTATAIRYGARSPFAAIVHAGFVLAAVMALAPALSYLPMASMAAMLILVAWNMSEAKHFIHMLKVAPKSDVMVLLACFSLTVIFDMVIAVGVGVVLAALLFMRRMAELSHAKLASGDHPDLEEPLPVGTIMYEIAGPLFFGAAQKAMSALETVARKNLKVILHMGAVPAMDVTGLVALESAVNNLLKAGTYVIIAGVQRQPLSVIHKGGLKNIEGKLHITASLHDAVAHARSVVLPTTQTSGRSRKVEPPAAVTESIAK